MPRRIKISTGTLEAFIKRSLKRARKLDRGEKLTPEFRITTAVVKKERKPKT